MSKIRRKHRNEVILAVAQRVVAQQNPGCYIPPNNAEVEKIYAALEAWLLKEGFDPKRFEFPQENQIQKGVAVSFKTKAEGGHSTVFLKRTTAS